MELILASASPRRQELLRSAGIPFTAQPTEIPEIPRAGEAPKAFAERLAREKAWEIHRVRPRHYVLGADTVVVADSQILGKPRDANDAARMLRLLSGRTHEVTTGVCLLVPIMEATGQDREDRDSKMKTAFEDVRSETTLVTMSALAEDDIHAYIATGEPMDKAGAYAIQGIASRWIPRIEGDYSNVVGLPIALIWRMLRMHASSGGSC
jgi:septum formation protein